VLKWRTFPAHLPLHGQRCWVQRWPITCTRLLATWDESNCEWHCTTEAITLPWYLVRLYAVAPADAQALIFPPINDPHRWRKWPDYRPDNQTTVWYHLLDRSGSPMHGTYNDGIFGESATGSGVPGVLVALWRPDLP